MTTVGRSIFLESTHPFFSLILSILFLKEHASRNLIPALLLGIAGMYFTVHADFFGDRSALSGDGLALLSAFCVAAYLIIARKTTNDFPLLQYLFFVYGIAALIILIILGVKQINFWLLPAPIWLLLIALALGPHLIGHSLLNWSSRRMPVYVVNMALLGESVLATIMAYVFLEEIPDLYFLLGALLIIVSIGWVFWKQRDASIS